MLDLLLDLLILHRVEICATHPESLVVRFKQRRVFPFQMTTIIVTLVGEILPSIAAHRELYSDA